MALEILQKFKKDISEFTLVPSGGGAFEISLNGKKIYSKLKTGEFPSLKEIMSAVDQAMSG